MLGEWDVPFMLTTPEGTLFLNSTGTDGRRYQLSPQKCNAGLPVRLTEDDMPQHDGKIPHRRWRSGYTCHLAIEPLVEVAGELDCAGGEDLVDMLDELGLHLNSMIRTGLVIGFPNARLSWTPTGHDCRMFDRVQLQSAPVPSLDGEMGGTLVEFDLDTPYPYYMECSDTTTEISGTATLTNEGNTDFYPVVEIDATPTAFTVTNASIVDIDGNPLQVEYDPALPGAVAIGGTDVLELVHFQGTAFLNGSGANRLGGVNMLTSDFFPLVPGDNDITIAGATGRVIWQSAWA